MHFPKNKIYSLIILFLLVFFAVDCFAYPELIGSGYSSCLSCHYNSHGGGPLNDLGKESFGRNFFKDSKFRPSFKYRGLWNKSSPGSKNSQETFYHMQSDINLTALSDSDENHLLSITFGNIPFFEEGTNNKYYQVLARDYFYRLRLWEEWYFYLGLMEKNYGIRHADHTAYSRSMTGISYADQVHGVVLHKKTENSEWSIQAYLGNPYVKEDNRFKGAAFAFENEYCDQRRLGLSILTEKNKNTQRDLFGMHLRIGLNDGSSLLTELGVINRNTLVPDSSMFGGYGLLQSKLLLRDGFYLNIEIDKYNPEFMPGSSDYWRHVIGLMIFTKTNLEVRADIVQGKTFSITDITADEWALRGQIHVAL